ALRSFGVIPVREIVDVAEEVRDEHRPRDVAAIKALLLTALDEGGELVVVLPPPPDDLLLSRCGQHVLTPEEDGPLWEELDGRLDDVDAHGPHDVVDGAASTDDLVEMRP